jgi:tetratricopeptide (TPR) repeat protein
MSRLFRRFLIGFALTLMCLAFVGLALMQRAGPPETVTADWQTVLRNNQAQGYLQSALYAVNRAAAESGWTADLHRQAGDLWYEIGDYSRALPHYETASLNTTDVFLLRRLSELYLQSNRPADALTHVEHLLILDSQNAWGHYQMGLLLAASEPRRAREHLGLITLDASYSLTADTLLTALNSDTADPAYSFQVGAVLAKLALWQYAEWAFLFAAEAGSPFAEAQAYTGLMRDMQGKDGSAAIQQAVVLNPNSADVWLVQGIHLRMQRDYTGSQIALYNAMVLDPQNPAIHAELGATYQAAGLIDDAAYWMQSAVQASGNDPLLSQVLMQFYTNEADMLPEEALTALSTEAGSSPENPDTLSAYGWALHVSGDSALGLAKIDEALALDPANPRVLYDRARLLLDTGVPEAARPLLEQVAASETTYARNAQAILEGMD